jgi:hypothetical protein
MFCFYSRFCFRFLLFVLFLLFVAYPAPMVVLEVWFGFRHSDGVLGVIRFLVYFGYGGIGLFRSFGGDLVSYEVLLRRTCLFLAVVRS